MRIRYFLAQDDRFGSSKNLTPFTLYNFLIIPSSHPEVREEIILTPKLTHVA